MAAEALSVSWEFDIRAQKPIQTSVQDHRDYLQTYNIGGSERFGIFDSRRN